MFPGITIEKYHAAAAAAAAKSFQSCPTLCDPMDGSPPGSAIPGILQARTLGKKKTNMYTLTLSVYGELKQQTTEEFFCM